MRKHRLQQQLDDATRRAADSEARARAAAALAAQLREAVEALPHAVLLCDPSGSVVLRNRCSRELEGGRPVAALVEKAAQEAVAAASAGRTVTRTLDLHGPPPRTLVVTATPLDRLGTVVVVDDLSERRRLDAVRRDFVANVSHELRTPLGALTVLAEALADEQDAALVARLVGRITAEAERAARLVDDLLDLSRIEAGDTGREPVDVEGLLASAAERVAPVAAQHEVAVDVRPVPPGLSVPGDAAQLTSAVANLLDNAVKYSDAGSAVVAAATAGDGVVEVAVRDTGIGIPTRDLERVFERFYRVDRARSRETGGTGLGLAIVRHVATNHAGEVLVESQEGVGSTFVLRLPTD
jgi:two-component system sensor histidine kinase SenX3